MVKYKWMRTTLFIGFVLSLPACDRVGDPTLSNELSPQPVATLLIGDTLTKKTQMSDIQMTQPAQPSSSSNMESLIEKAKEDLAQRLSIEIAEIRLVEARDVVWPDSSLGCPQPGMKYRQVPEDGALIVLQAQGVEFEYHSGGSRGLFLCEKVFSSPEKPPQVDITKLTPPAPDNGIPPGEDQ